MFTGFDEFDLFDVPTRATTIHGRTGGSGPPVLLLHGIPETHLMWHRVAPVLAERYTVVATDLRGYGDSGTPPSTPDHAPYSMRAIADEQVEVMRSLGHERFAVVGHDRGARCAYRMALDHPDAVARLGVLDVIPTGDEFARADKEFALGFWVWTFLVARAPDVVVDHMLDSWSEDGGAFPPELRREYATKLADPATIHAICEEYRAAATLDVEHDDADRGRRRIGCPTLVLWSRSSGVARWEDPLDVWRAWAPDARGGSVPVGHFLPEEAPDTVAREVLAFLASSTTTSV